MQRSRAEHVPKHTALKQCFVQDLDIDFKLVLTAGTYDQLMGQLQRDCALLESLRVMDYSLLLGVHYLSWGPDQWDPPKLKVRFLAFSTASII